MSVITYQNLALDWQPAADNSRNFQRIIALVLTVALVLMCLLTVVKVPEENRRLRAPVPERIAEFIAHKTKPPVELPKPVVKPPPKPVVEEKKPEIAPTPAEIAQPLREKIQARDIERKPLTDSEKAARRVAGRSGLLALSSELKDLADTTEIQAKMGKALSGSGSEAGADQGTLAARQATAALSAGIAQTGGEVHQAQYASKLSSTELDARKVEKVKSVALGEIEKSSKSSAASNLRSARAGEDVSLVFDKNKSSLYSLYERERRSTPDLQGKIVFQLILSPAGDVIEIKIISSDLHNPELESRLLSRIKTFKFKAGGEKPTTITYPVEFLPS